MLPEEKHIASVDSTRKLHFVVVATFLGAWAIALALYIALDSKWLRPSQMFIILCSTLVVLAIFASKLLRAFYPGYSLVFHLPLFISVLVLISWGFPSLFGFIDEEFWQEHRLRFWVEPVNIARGWVMIAVGLISIWVGYAFGLRKHNIRNGHSESANSFAPSLTLIMLIYVVITVLRLIRILVTGVEYGAQKANWGPLIVFDQTLGYIESIRFLVLVIVTRQVYQKQWPYNILVALIAIELFFAFLSGFMKPVLHLAVAVLGTIMSIGKYPGRSQLLLFTSAFLILSILIVPITEELRTTHLRTVDTRSLPTIWTAVHQAYDATWGKGFEYGWNSFIEKTVGRQSKVALSPAVILQRTPSEIPYLGIKEFMSQPLYFVPRFIWTGKPLLSLGQWYSVTYLNMPKSTTSSSAMTIFGEAYLYNGWVTLILGMLILGFLLAKFFNLTVLAGRPVIYLAILPTFLSYEGQYSTLVIGLSQKWLVLFVFYIFLNSFSIKNTASTERLFK